MQSVIKEAVIKGAYMYPAKTAELSPLNLAYARAIRSV